jgi:nucleoside-triphosphatase
MNLLLTGRPGIGKTTVLRNLASRLAERKVTACGFLAVEERIDQRRVGFRLQPIGHGDGKLMAHVDLISSVRVGHYGVDVEIVSYMVDMALRRDAGLVLVDEIGAMECASTRFVNRIRELLDGSGTVIATIAAHGGGFIEECRARADVEIIEVTQDNREALAEELAARVVG